MVASQVSLSGHLILVVRAAWTRQVVGIACRAVSFHDGTVVGTTTLSWAVGVHKELLAVLLAL